MFECLNVEMYFYSYIKYIYLINQIEIYSTLKKYAVLGFVMLVYILFLFHWWDYLKLIKHSSIGSVSGLSDFLKQGNEIELQLTKVSSDMGDVVLNFNIFWKRQIRTDFSFTRLVVNF